jgi:hypothetical protein
LGEYFDINEFTTKFYEKDENGLPVLDNGVPVLKMSEELMDVLEVTHPKIQRLVEVAKAQGIDRKNIFGLMGVFNETSSKSRPSGLTKYPVRGQGDGGDDDEVTYTIEDDAVRNAYSLVVNQNEPRRPDGSPNEVSELGPRYVPQEIRLQGVAMDKPVFVNPRVAIDLNTGGRIPEQVGEQKFTPTRMQLQMYHHGDKRDPKTLLMQPSERQLGDYIWTSPSFESMEAVMNADDWIGNYRKNKKNNANYIEPRWYVQGILEPAVVDPMAANAPAPRQVMIPYDEVRGEMRAKYKWDIDRVPLKQRHYLDLTWYLMDRFPDKDKEWVTNTAKGIKNGSIKLSAD